MLTSKELELGEVGSNQRSDGGAETCDAVISPSRVERRVFAWNTAADEGSENTGCQFQVTNDQALKGDLRKKDEEKGVCKTDERPGEPDQSGGNGNLSGDEKSPEMASKFPGKLSNTSMCRFCLNLAK